MTTRPPRPTAKRATCQADIDAMTQEEARQWLITNDREAADYWAGLSAETDYKAAVRDNCRDFGFDEPESEHEAVAGYAIYQLAPDHATYGADAGKFIVTSADHEHELSGPMTEMDAKAFAALLEALTAAERFIRGFEDDEQQEGIDALLVQIRAALPIGTSTGQPSQPQPIIIEVRGGVVVDVQNVPPGYQYEVKDHDDREADDEAAGRAA